MNKFSKLFLAILICEGAGFIGAIFTFNSVNTWYITLNKPFFNPPPWIFGPVWTILYLMMGISLYLAWGTKKVSLKWFWVQLVLNSLWSILFFGLKNPTLAFLGIILLFLAIFMTMKSFWKYKRTASWLLVPYLLWVTFASVLNASIVLLNR
ncbi:MAG TPA: TspO/MBR family protein [Candidatus Saccharimonadales bacterium]|nr:TspO/MBR family protein [Candidatus Saccharimonadales bacterium]